MNKALPFLVLFLCTVFATTANITFNYDENDLFLHDTDYTMQVTVTNIAGVNDTFKVYAYTNIDYIEVNKTSSYGYTIENLADGASNTKNIGIEIQKGMPFDETSYFCVEAYDSNNTMTYQCVDINTPAFNSISASITFDPATKHQGTLKVTGRTSNDVGTTRFNTTYKVKRNSDGVVCLNGTSEDKSIVLKFENCSADVYDIEVEGHADTFKKTDKINDYFIFKEIIFNSTFYRIEDFGFERPLDELDSVKGGESIIVRGYAVYDDGTALSHPPDVSTSYLKITVEEHNETKVPGPEGLYQFIFDAPANASTYTVTLKAYGEHDYVSTITYKLKVNNTKQYAVTPANTAEILSNVNMSVAGDSFQTRGEELEFNVTVGNSNTISLTGKPVLAGSDQFAFVPQVSDKILAGKERTYSLKISPKNFTKPGTYDLTISYDTIYGSATTPIQIRIPDPIHKESELNVYRYVDYSSNSAVRLKLVNRLGYNANVKLREVISKEITETLNGSSVTFSPGYTRVIDDDPVIEWDLVLNSGESTDVVYYTGMLVEEEWFSEPSTVYSRKRGEATVAPTSTPVPTVEPTPTPEAVPESIDWLRTVGIIFVFIVLLIVVMVFVYNKKKKEVNAFLDKFVPIELEKTVDEVEREKIKKIFMTDEPKKPVEKKKSWVEELEEKYSPYKIAKQVNDLFSPKPKTEGPTKYKAKKKPKTEKEKAKEEAIKNLKEIGKGFSENF